MRPKGGRGRSPDPLVRAARGIVVKGIMTEMTPPSLADGPLVFDPLSPAFIADPYRFYRRLRAEAPVFRTPQGLWLLSSYATWSVRICGWVEVSTSSRRAAAQKRHRVPRGAEVCKARCRC